MSWEGGWRLAAPRRSAAFLGGQPERDARQEDGAGRETAQPRRDLAQPDLADRSASAIGEPARPSRADPMV